jgi:hypothetical protein
MSRIVGRRILGHRLCACGCGQRITLTTRNRTQRYFSKQCKHEEWAQSMCRIRAVGIWKLRRAKFGTEIAKMVREGRITEPRLLELCVQVYRSGYEAGYVRGRQRRQDTRLEKAA